MIPLEPFLRNAPPPGFGDGTAPAGFPSYRRCTLPDGSYGVECRFQGCGHKGTIGPPATLECGPACPCLCCRCLQGETLHGVTIGRRP